MSLIASALQQWSLLWHSGVSAGGVVDSALFVQVQMRGGAEKIIIESINI